jgi:pSer/pThr/pTyr-binding forkhead associated (FHA) protein
MAKLILKHKAEVLKEYALKGDDFPFTIGSEPGNDMVVPDKLVSMTHFEIAREDNQYFVRDLKSAFGTYLNGSKISNTTEIHDGDVIQIGEHAIVFKNPPEADSFYGNDNSSLGHSISNFLHDVKDAVVDAVERETPSSPSQNARTSPLTEYANEATGLHRSAEDSFVNSDAGNNNHHSAAHYDVEAVDAEISEVLGRSPGAGDAAPAAKAFGHYEKSPYYLLAIHGPYLGKKYQLNFGETKVGRDSKLNDIVIRHNKKGAVDPSISRRHATFTYQDGSFYVTDKRSQSRTYVNQQKLSVTDEARLMPGDEIEIVSDQQSTIFRLVTEGKWDFSPPQRAGEWWLRYYSKAMNLATIVVLGIGLIANIMAWRSCAIVTDVPEPFTVEPKTFMKIEDGRKALSGGAQQASPSSRAHKAVPLPVLAEINGDDNVDVVVVQPSGVLIAVDGKKRRRLWEATNFVLNRTYSPVAADLNGDGHADLVALTADGHLVAMDGHHGAEMWTSPFFENELIGPPIVADFNGDGYIDVATTSIEGKLNVGYSRVFNMEWVDIDIGLPSHVPLSAGDLDGDGDDEILIGTERGIVLIYDGVERRLLANIDVNEELNKLKGTFYEDNQIRHPIGLADLNGNQTPELIISSRQGNLLCMALGEKSEQKSNFAQNLWWTNLAGSRQQDSLKGTAEFSYPFVLADLDNDNLADVIALSDDGSIKAFRGRGVAGQRQPELWQTAPDTCGWVSIPRVCDFNKDLAVDIVITNEKRELKILSGKTGDLLWRDDATIASATTMPLLGDLLGDAALDIVLLSADGVVYHFATNRRVLDGSIVWGQMYGTPTNTSTAASSDPAAGRYHVVMLVSGLIMMAAVAGNVLARYRRWQFAKR